MGFFNKTQLFTSSMAKSAEQSQSITVIAPDSQFRGYIEITGPLHVDGIIEGDIQAQELMEIGRQGQVQGLIHAKSLRVSGIVEGEIWCRSVVILAGGQVKGKLHCDELVVEVGGNFFGERDNFTKQESDFSQAAADLEVSMLDGHSESSP